MGLLFLYLLFSYVRLYHYIGYNNLKSPYTNNNLTLENKQQDEILSYIALGDSLSAGVGSDDPTKTFTYIYASNLSHTYGQVTLTNLALPGGTTTDVINSQLPETINKNPDYITLLIGTNDMHNKRTLKGFYENYYYILSELLSKTDAQITVLNIPYLGSSKVVYPPFSILLNWRTKQYNKIIENVINDIGDKNRIKFIDLYKNTYSLSKSELNYYSADEFHPSGKAYVIWGNLINEH